MEKSGAKSIPTADAKARVAEEPQRNGFESHSLLRLQKTMGNQAVQRLLRDRIIQAKLAVSHPSDAYEREADHIAENVVSAPESQVQRTCACGGRCPKCQTQSSDFKVSQRNDPAEIEADQIVDKAVRMPVGEEKPVTNSGNARNLMHRKCSECGAGETKIQRKALSSGQNIPSQSPAHVQDAMSSGGQPLDVQTRNFFEPRLGYDLGNVRIHTDSKAGESAKAIDANAYTLGNNIVFSAGQYKPESDSGKRLLAHELAHVSQAASSSTIRRDTIYRQPDASQIVAEIQMLRIQLMAPVNPLRQMQEMRLMQLEAMLSKTGKPSAPSKPKPTLDLPFEYRFAQAWEKAKEVALQKVRDEDKASRGSSITRGMIEVKDLAPTPREVWKAGIYGGLFRNDERALVDERSAELASESYGKRYEAARYGHIYGDERYYESSSARRDDDTEIWSRGRAYGLFLPGEKARVLKISVTGIGMASTLNTRAGLVDPNSLDAARLMDEIHKFTSDPAVVLLGPEIERLFGPFGYTYRDQEDRWFAADEINKAYQKSLQGQILKDPNASLAERWDECLSRRGFEKNNLEGAAFDPKCFQSQDEFNREYSHREAEYQKRFDTCGHSGPKDYQCRDRIDAEYYPRRAAREDYQIRQSYQQYQQNIDSVVSSGAIATGGRLAGYVTAKILGRDEDEALAWSETAADVGGFGDAFLTIKAGAKARTGTQNYNEGGGHVVSRDVPMTPQNVAAPPKNEPLPPPGKTTTTTSTASTDPWADPVPRPVDLSKNLQNEPIALVPSADSTVKTPVVDPVPDAKLTSARTTNITSTGPLKLRINMKFVNSTGELTTEGIEFLKREYPEKFGGFNEKQVRSAFEGDIRGTMWEKMVLEEIGQTVPRPPRGAKGKGQPFLITGKNFNGTVTEIEKRIPGSVKDRSVLNQTVGEFIDQNPALQKAAKALEGSKSEAVRNEWIDWFEKNRNSLIGDKKPDVLEVIPSRNLGVLYDPTLTVNSPFGPTHAFKTELYREILTKVTGMDIGAMDIGRGIFNLVGD